MASRRQRQPSMATIPEDQRSNVSRSSVSLPPSPSRSQLGASKSAHQVAPSPSRSGSSTVSSSSSSVKPSPSRSQLDASQSTHQVAPSPSRSGSSTVSSSSSSVSLSHENIQKWHDGVAKEKPDGKPPAYDEIKSCDSASQIGVNDDDRALQDLIDAINFKIPKTGTLKSLYNDIKRIYDGAGTVIEAKGTKKIYSVGLTNHEDNFIRDAIANLNQTNLTYQQFCGYDAKKTRLCDIMQHNQMVIIGIIKDDYFHKAVNKGKIKAKHITKVCLPIDFDEIGYVPLELCICVNNHQCFH